MLLCVQLKRPFMYQAALIGLLKREYMFYTQHCNRRQTKESLCRVLFPSERNRLGRAVIYTEFDNSTNGWHGQHRVCGVVSIRECVSFERKRNGVKIHQKFSKISCTFFLERKSWLSAFHNNYFIFVYCIQNTKMTR